MHCPGLFSGSLASRLTGPHFRVWCCSSRNHVAGSSQADVCHHCCMQDMVVSALPWSGPENGWRQPRRRVVYSLRLTIFALSVLLAVVVSASSDELAAAWVRGILSRLCLPGPHQTAAAAWGHNARLGRQYVLRVLLPPRAVAARNCHAGATPPPLMPYRGTQRWAM